MPYKDPQQQKARNRAYQDANRARIAAQRKVYREANREKIAAVDKSYREANREKAAARSRAWYEANREKAAATSKAWARTYPQKVFEHEIKRSYNITVEEYARLYHTQAGKCRGCEKALDLDSPNTHVDHCHTSGKVRGFLCRKCNLLLGHAEDSVETLMRLALYLGKHK